MKQLNLSNSPQRQEVEALKSRLRTLRKIFMPLLEKLVDEPDKVFIKWPNRKDKWGMLPFGHINS